MAKVDEFLKKYKENPEDIKNLYDLAVCYSEAKEYDKAKEYFEKLVSVEPAMFDAYHGIGYCLQKQKKYVDAIQMFRKGLKIDKPKIIFKDSYKKLKIGTYKNLAVCHIKINETANAMACYNIISKIDPSLEKDMEERKKDLAKIKSLLNSSEVVMY